MSLEQKENDKYHAKCCDPYKRGCQKRSPSRYDHKDFLSVWSAIEQLGWQRSTYSGNWTCPDCIQSRLPHKPENIVILQYADNTSYVQIKEMEQAPPKLKIDVEAGTWTNGSGKPVPIGSGYMGNRIIGVFDRTDFFHLQVMVSLASEATRGPMMVD